MQRPGKLLVAGAYGHALMAQGAGRSPAASARVGLGGIPDDQATYDPDTPRPTQEREFKRASYTQSVKAR